MLVLLLSTSLALAQTLFPSVQATRLSGEAIEVPAAFGDGLDLVLVGFSRAHQEDVDTWVPLAERLAEERGMGWWQTPVMGDVGGLLRPVIQGAMRASMEDDVESHVVPLYGDREVMVRAIGVTDETEILVGLVGRDGRFAWSTRGPWTEAGERALVAALEAAGPE